MTLNKTIGFWVAMVALETAALAFTPMADKPPASSGPAASAPASAPMSQPATLPASRPATLPASQPATKPASQPATAPASGFVNVRCPIMGTAINPASVPPALVRQYKGQKVAFCCGMCPPQWDRLTPAQKDAKLKAALAPK